MMMGVAQVMGMKPTLRSFFSGTAAAMGDGGKRRRGPNCAQERPPAAVVREHRAQHRLVHRARPARVGRARWRRVMLWGVARAGATARCLRSLGVERVIEAHPCHPSNRACQRWRWLPARLAADRQARSNTRASRAPRKIAEPGPWVVAAPTIDWDRLASGTTAKFAHGVCPRVVQECDPGAGDWIRRRPTMTTVLVVREEACLAS